jgi:hypothetical protein
MLDPHPVPPEKKSVREPLWGPPEKIFCGVFSLLPPPPGSRFAEVGWLVLLGIAGGFRNAGGGSSTGPLALRQVPKLTDPPSECPASRRDELRRRPWPPETSGNGCGSRVPERGRWLFDGPHASIFRARRCHSPDAGGEPTSAEMKSGAPRRFLRRPQQAVPTGRPAHGADSQLRTCRKGTFASTRARATPLPPPTSGDGDFVHVHR